MMEREYGRGNRVDKVEKSSWKGKSEFCFFSFLEAELFCQGIEADRDEKVKNVTINYSLSIPYSCDRKTLPL